MTVREAAKLEKVAAELDNIISHHTALNRRVGRDPAESNTIGMARRALDEVVNLLEAHSKRREPYTRRS